MQKDTYFGPKALKIGSRYRPEINKNQNHIVLLKCCRNHVAFDGILEHVVETMSHLTAF